MNEAEAAKRKIRRVVVLAITVVVVVLVVAGFIVWRVAQGSKSNPDDPAAVRTRLTEKIGRYLLLPENEDPTVARIKDKNKFRGQPFFKDAENGDYLIIYETDGTAILYREQDNLLVKVGTITVNETKEEPLKPSGQ